MACRAVPPSLEDVFVALTRIHRNDTAEATMFRGLWAILKKEVIHIKRDPATRFVLAIPLFELLLFRLRHRHRR